MQDPCLWETPRDKEQEGAGLWESTAWEIREQDFMEKRREDGKQGLGRLNAAGATVWEHWPQEQGQTRAGRIRRGAAVWREEHGQGRGTRGLPALRFLGWVLRWSGFSLQSLLWMRGESVQGLPRNARQFLALVVSELCPKRNFKGKQLEVGEEGKGC